MNENLQAVVAEADDIHPDIRIIRLRPRNSPFPWRAGQFMEIAFPGFPPRPYSIASAPNAELPEFHIRNTKRGGASQHAVTSLTVGDTVFLRGPLGNAVLPPGDRRPLVLIAGG